MFEEHKKNLIKLQKDLGLVNIHQAPTLEKISINASFGEYKDNKEYIKEIEEDMGVIAGQKPFARYSKKAISGFKLRENELIGYAVTLRGVRAWEFLEKLIKAVLPRVRDFRGLSNASFDGKGNYSFGITEHFVFPEVNADKVKYLKSLQINIKTTAENDEAGRKFLESLGFPFKK